MRACIQRVCRGSVVVGEECVGRIDAGLVVLLGVARDDAEHDAQMLAEKITMLRIFDDDQGRMNRSLQDVGGSMLVVSQFTLLADCRQGRRPSYMDAAAPQVAESLYEHFVAVVRHAGIPVATGQFRQHMLVELVNDGPVTILLDTAANMVKD